jgi:hypothetical protein
VPFDELNQGHGSAVDLNVLALEVNQYLLSVDLEHYDAVVCLGFLASGLQPSFNRMEMIIDLV